MVMRYLWMRMDISTMQKASSVPMEVMLASDSRGSSSASSAQKMVVITEEITGEPEALTRAKHLNSRPWKKRRVTDTGERKRGRERTKTKRGKNP